MKKFNKIIPVAMLAATLTTSAFAAPNAINVNNTELDGISYIVNEGKAMIPVRAVCEQLGFEVEYDNESHIVTLVKLPVTVTFLPTQDGYTFARTAPMMLGTDPILVNNTTYVPAEFVNEILKGEYSIAGDVLNIKYGETVEENVEVQPAETVTATASIAEIGENFVTVMDYVRGEVVVYIDDKTEIVDKDGKAIDLAELDVDKELTVEYAPAMTMSLPPQTTGIKIAQTDAEAKDVVDGEVCEIIAEDGKITGIAVGDKKDPMNQIVLNVADETTVTTAEGTAAKLEDIQEGAYIRGLASRITTRSIPAQKPCYSITVMQ